jgi:hypothetical protein
MGSSFSPVLAVAHIMRDFHGPWFVSGGWAIDLFLGKVTREHSDIEIGIYRRDQHFLWHHLPEWTLEKAIQTPEGGKWVAWERAEELLLPVHQIRATRLHGECTEFEFFLNERDEMQWTSRRHAGLNRAAEEVAIPSFLDIPILSPEIQLLFKAKQTRHKDQADFERTLPAPSPTQVRWLTAALTQYHPEHPWIRMLAS